MLSPPRFAEYSSCSTTEPVRIELKGEASAAFWSPNVELFEDKKHLTRSAMQLTLLQQSKLDLAGLVEKAAASEKGVPFRTRQSPL